MGGIPFQTTGFGFSIFNVGMTNGINCTTSVLPIQLQSHDQLNRPHYLFTEQFNEFFNISIIKLNRSVSQSSTGTSYQENYNDGAEEKAWNPIISQPRKLSHPSRFRTVKYGGTSNTILLRHPPVFERHVCKNNFFFR